MGNKYFNNYGESATVVKYNMFSDVNVEWEQIETLDDFLSYIYNNFNNEFYRKTLEIINFIEESHNDELNNLSQENEILQNENEDLNWEIECLENQIDDLREELRGD